MDESAAAPREPRFRQASTTLLARLLGLLRTRVELAGVELQEQREQVTQSTIALVAAGACFAFALLVATFGVIAAFWDSYRYGAIIGVCAIYAIAGLLFLVRNRRLRREARAPFAATLAELERDRKALLGEGP